MLPDTSPQTAESPFDPYKPPSSPEEDLEPLQGRLLLVKADRSARLVARIVDAIVNVTPLLLLMGSGVILGHSRDARLVGNLLVLGLSLTIVVLNLRWLYTAGQSIGKRLVGIAILRSDGSRVTLRRLILLRSGVLLILSLVPFAGTVIALLNPLFIFRRDHKCIHDHIADTFVVEVGHQDLQVDVDMDGPVVRTWRRAWW